MYRLPFAKTASKRTSLNTNIKRVLMRLKRATKLVSKDLNKRHKLGGNKLNKTNSKFYNTRINCLNKIQFSSES